jgi:hypothetical protein
MWGSLWLQRLSFETTKMTLRCVIFLKRSYGSDQTRRLLALAVCFDGGYRVWLTGKALGQTVNLDAAQRQALADLVERGPILAVDGGHWRLVDLVVCIHLETASRYPQNAGASPGHAPSRHAGRDLVAG